MPAAKKSRKKKVSLQKIVIDESKGLVFETEDALYAHFHNQIKDLEKEHNDLRPENDIPVKDFKKFDKFLTELLTDPLEVWEDSETLPNQVVTNYLGEYEYHGKPLYYVAIVYLALDKPTFIYFHFPTTDKAFYEKYRRGRLIYDETIKNAQQASGEGDALGQGDELAVGLYKAMMKVRSEKDIHEGEFQTFIKFREETIETADEIWRSSDTQGNTLVNFIKDFSDQHDQSGELYYVVVTLEDTPSNSHALLFSFPTRDKNLVERYRHGENLHAEEVVQESSH